MEYLHFHFTSVGRRLPYWIEVILLHTFAAVQMMSRFCLVLLQVRQGIEAEDSELMLDNMWSMQYRVPGPLCAFAGALATERVSDVQADNDGFTHGLHIRFPSLEVRISFHCQWHPCFVGNH